MKRLVLTALAATLTATVHADNEAVGTPLAMPAEMQEVFARNPATASNNERFANAEAAAVYQAAHDGDLARARQILAQHPGVLQSHNTREMTPLGVAMMSGDRKAFNALLDLGADPTWLGDMRDTDLHLAAILTDRYWLDALIKRGVNLEIPNTLGETPLFAALGPETRDNFELLLKAGADIHAPRRRRRDPAAQGRRYQRLRCRAAPAQTGRRSHPARPRRLHLPVQLLPRLRQPAARQRSARLARRAQHPH